MNGTTIVLLSSPNEWCGTLITFGSLKMEVSVVTCRYWRLYIYHHFGFRPPCAVTVFSGCHATVFDRLAPLLSLSPGTTLHPLAFYWLIFIYSQFPTEQIIPQADVRSGLVHHLIPNAATEVKWKAVQVLKSWGMFSAWVRFVAIQAWLQSWWYACASASTSYLFCACRSSSFSERNRRHSRSVQ